MHVQVVTFNLKDMSEQDYNRACEEQFAAPFAQVPGLVSKIWLANSESNTYGGVYLWKDKTAMEAFLESELFKTLASHPNLENITSQDFGVLEKPTQMTRGLAA